MLYYLERIYALCVMFKLQSKQLSVWEDFYRTLEANSQAMSEYQYGARLPHGNRRFGSQIQ